MPHSFLSTFPRDCFHTVSVSDDRLRAELLRLGYLDGPVTCRHHLRKGPVVISYDRTDIAARASMTDEVIIERVSGDTGRPRGST